MHNQVLPLTQLKLDINNFRHPHVEDEASCVNCLNASNPSAYVGLLQSILSDGYLPTENILVIESEGGCYTVMEGNRRVSLLKLIHGLIQLDSVNIDDQLRAMVRSAPEDLKRETREISCSVYSASEMALVKRIVARIHAKGDSAARRPWEAIGKARQSRSEGNRESALDLLEKVLEINNIVAPEERYQWLLNYPLTILQEILPKICGALGIPIEDVPANIQTMDGGDRVTEIVIGIGRGDVHFRNIRESDFLDRYGIIAASHQGVESAIDARAGGIIGDTTTSDVSPAMRVNGDSTSAVAGGAVGALTHRRIQTIRVKLRRCLQKIGVYGGNREKIKKLILEMKGLDAEKTPLIFAYSLRSLIDMSAHAYAKENDIPVFISTGSHGEHKAVALSSLIETIKGHIVANSPYWAIRENKNRLESASRRCTQTRQSFLSISDLNDIIHNTTTLVNPQLLESEVPIIIPLISAMNNGQ